MTDPRNEGTTGGVVIREARREDCQILLDLSKEIANYHKHFDAPQIDVKVLEHDTFDVENPSMGFYVAEIDGSVIGYGHYLYGYTIRMGRNIFLQDLYVQEKFRNRRVGEKLMQAIAKKAIDQKIAKMEFVVTDWNPAKNFYKRMGAVDMTETESFHVYKIGRASIEKIASDT